MGKREEENPLERITSAKQALDDLMAREFLQKLAPAGVFGYAAGKSIIAKKLVKHFPTHKVYTEPFCGSAAMYHTKEKSDVEVLNDLDKEVAFAHRAIKSLSKSELAEMERKDWTGSADTFAKVKKSAPTTKVDRLYKFLYLINFSYGKGRKSFNPGAAGATSTMHKRLTKFQPRYKDTKILCGHYDKALNDYDGKDAFHFLDPPYPGYKAGGGGVGEKDFNEPEFRKRLDALKGKFLVTYGVKGKLDTSGYEVKRMRQPRTIRTMRGVGGDQFLTHLLISNYKIAAKSLGDGVELDDVMQIVDTGDGGDRIMVCGSRTSVSVPEQIVGRAFKGESLLTSYPEAPGPILATAQLRFLEKGVEMDLAFPVNDAVVAWSIDVQRADVIGDPTAVAKSFSVEGSRYFAPLTKGVPAREMPSEVVASAVVPIDAPGVELGTQTDDFHEYFISKGEELVGQLTIERQPLAEQYPWIATLTDHKFIPNAVLKGAPMPPAGISALPQSLERVVPVEMRYWEKRGEDAIKARDALVASEFFTKDTVAMVDGEPTRVVSKLEIYEPAEWRPTVDEWTVAKAQELAGMPIVEVFGSGRDALAKAGESCVFIDAGEAIDGAIDVLAKSMDGRPGHYVITAVDSPAARASMRKLGRVFRFRPSPELGAHVVKRLFVSSQPVREPVEWLDKAKETYGDLHREGRARARKFDAKRALSTIGPPNEWSGAVAGLIGPERRKAMKDAWDALTAEEKKATSAAFIRNFSKSMSEDATKLYVAKAIYSAEADDDPSELTAATPTDDKPDLGKGDLGGTFPGQLVPSQGFGEQTTGSAEDRSRRKKIDKSASDSFTVLKAEGDDEERFVLGIVLMPDTVDAQNDIYSADEVRASAHRYMEEFQNIGHMHKQIINTKASVLESYLAPCDFSVGDQPVKKGTWLMGVHVKDDALWKQCKSGGLTGFSIGGSAQRKPDPKADKKYKQRKAGAEKSIEYQGIPVTIDRPKGFVQTGEDEAGKAWSREYKFDYGFIPRTKGGDGEGLDVYVGPDADAKSAFWIVQQKANGAFDEYKVMVGFDSAAAAKKAYLDHTPAKYFGGMRETSIEQMKALLNQEPNESLAKRLAKIAAMVGA